MPKKLRDEITSSDTVYIKNNHRDKTVLAMSNELGLDQSVIRQYMEFCKLSEKKVYWTEEEINTLKELAETKTASYIANKIDRAERQVKFKAKQMGIIITQEVRHWTSFELDYLSRNWGNKSLESIAKTLKRTPCAVQGKAQHLKLGPTSSHSEELTLQEFSKLSGITEDRIRGVLSRKHGFPLIRKRVTPKRYRLFVRTYAALSWMQRHKDLWDATKVSIYLFTIEPNWLKEKKEQDRNSELNTKITKVNWTQRETDLLKLYIEEGYDIATISEKLNKSKEAVYGKICRLGYGYKVNRFYKGKDFKFIRENYLDMTDKQLAEVLGRSERSIKKHRHMLGLSRCKRGKEDTQE